MYIYNILLSCPEICNRHANRYINLIKSRDVNRELEYSENHHILPKSLFPEHKDNSDNIIALTAKEHYLAHRILLRVFPKSIEMFYAFWCMCNGWQNTKDHKRHIPFVSSRLYSELKLVRSLETSKRMQANNHLASQEVKDKIIEMYGGLGNGSEIIFARHKQTMLLLYGYENFFQTPEFIEKNRQATIERNKDLEYRKSQGKKISKSLESVDRKGENNSFYGKSHSEDTKDKIRLTKLGKIWPKFSCLCCHKVMGSNNFTQHMRTHTDSEQNNHHQCQY